MKKRYGSEICYIELDPGEKCNVILSPSRLKTLLAKIKGNQPPAENIIMSIDSGTQNANEMGVTVGILGIAVDAVGVERYMYSLINNNVPFNPDHNWTSVKIDHKWHYRIQASGSDTILSICPQYDGRIYIAFGDVRGKPVKPHCRVKKLFGSKMNIC